MATKNYMINDKWLDLDKQNIVELQSVDGVLDSLKVNGSEIETPSGKITITENGTDIDVAQYALADVNVEGGGGSSDFSTATGTIHTSIADQAVVIDSAVVVNENDPAKPLVPFIDHDWYDTDSWEFVLYNGAYVIALMPSGYDITDISATGGATVGDFGEITITGDFTLNVTLGDPI